ncbi:MAG: lasso peptide biosynthesis B2 protein [Pseudonocardiaceae bacterium]
MTQPQTVERGGRLPLRHRPAALLAVGAGRVLAHLPPRRIRAVLTVLRRRAAPATYSQVKGAQDAVLAVSVLCGGRYCLQRSLATTLLCRIRGVWPTWCTGVRTAPFVAHAWVEADGQPVGEPQGPGYYHPLITIPPERLSARQRVQ